MIGAAEFEDVLVYFYNAGTNSVDGTRFSTERTGQFTALYVEGSANVSITDVTVVDGTVETSASNGVWVRGADSTVSVTNSTFDSLTYGLRLQSGGTMTQSGNTFIECSTDLLGF